MKIEYVAAPLKQAPGIKEQNLPNGWYKGQIRGFNKALFYKRGDFALVFGDDISGPTLSFPMFIALVDPTCSSDTIEAFPVKDVTLKVML